VDNFVHKCAQLAEAAITALVNPVDKNSHSFKTSLKINGLLIKSCACTLKGQHNGGKLAVDDFVHKSHKHRQKMFLTILACVPALFISVRAVRD
jgi:hypothetical protein